jgi:predicted lipoprotein with Yx(FWY)xxD motif
MPLSSIRLVAAVGAVMALAGCGDDAGDASAMTDSGAAATPSRAGAKPKRVTRITLRESDYGKVLFDGRGQALYLFTADADGQSNCSGECAEAWPPFYARGRLEAGPGVKQRLLGRRTRPGGSRQVTYAGHPLYFYVHDPRGEILCHDVTEFGGDWLVVTASGEPAT